jgi:hypothetical protein
MVLQQAGGDSQQQATISGWNSHAREWTRERVRALRRQLTQLAATGVEWVEKTKHEWANPRLRRRHSE